MSGPVLAILLTVVVHAIGGALLIWALGGSDLRGFFSTRADGDGGLPPAPPRPARPAGPGGGLPLPDAEPAPVLARDGSRLSERRRPRPRRPEHAPDPRRAPVG